MNVDTGQLATWQIAIYWLQDAERFDELAATATNIFIALGHSDGVAQAEQGRTCITQATEIGWTAPALLPPARSRQQEQRGQVSENYRRRLAT
jgi:hypothetical protein